MASGTIALTNGSTSVAGTGTSFTSELKVGDFVYVTVGGAPYTLVVASVSSDTQIVLAVAFDGPTTSGLAWNSVPASLQVAITQKILNDFASVARGRILDFQNWQKIYSDAQSVTVTRPDRTQFTGPSWGYMASQFSNKADKTALDAYAKKGANNDITSISGLTTALSISQGGTGANNREAAKTSLETGFQRNTQSWSNFLTMVSSILPNGGVISLRDNTSASTIYQYANAFVSRNGDTMAALSVDHATGNVVAVGLTTNPLGANGNILWGSRNTTIDGNGFIKRASPIARVFSGEVLPSDYTMSGFVRAGQCMANEEAEGVVATRVSEGVYELTGCLGLATESWTVEIPQDSNGYRQIYIQSSFDNGRLLIKTYHRVNADAPKFLQNIVQGKADGDPIDIPSGRWVDLRLSMPDDSIYNTRIKKLKLAAEDNIGSSES